MFLGAHLLVLAAFPGTGLLGGQVKQKGQVHMSVELQPASVARGPVQNAPSPGTLSKSSLQRAPSPGEVSKSFFQRAPSPGESSES